MNWSHQTGKWESEDKMYQITNTGFKDIYALYKYDPEYRCHCNLIFMGKLEECKSYEA